MRTKKLSRKTIRKRIIEIIGDNGGDYPSSIAKKLSMSPTSVSRHLKFLENFSDLITSEWTKPSVNSNPHTWRIKRYRLLI